MNDLIVYDFQIKWVPVEKYNELVKHVLELEEKLSKRIDVLEKGHSKLLREAEFDEPIPSDLLDGYENHE